MMPHIIVEDDPRKTKAFIAGIIVGYFLCFIIGLSVGIMWPAIMARLA